MPRLASTATAIMMLLGCGPAGAEPSTSGTDHGPGPSISPDPGCPGEDLPHRTMDAFWRTLDDQYALFEVRLPGRRWEDLGAQACDGVRADMSDGELFDAIIALARELDDGHIQLEGAGREADGWATGYAHTHLVTELEGNVQDRYMNGDLSWGANDEFAWGDLGGAGYLSITSLDELSGSGDEDDDRDAAVRAMERVMSDLGHLPRMIVDVRANSGGWDEVALHVARFFAGRRALAWSKRTRNGPGHGDFGPWEDVFVEDAVQGAYPGQVVLLTSGYTFSAAETFTLAMRVRDHVTVLGERSSGHFSDLYDLPLPNGFEATFSGELYRAADGQIYEKQGVPVDLLVPFDAAGFARGRDSMLEEALALTP